MFIQSPVGGHKDRFQVLVITNRAFIYQSLGGHLLSYVLGKYRRVGLLRCNVSVYLYKKFPGSKCGVPSVEFPWRGLGGWGSESGVSHTPSPPSQALCSNLVFQ